VTASTSALIAPGRYFEELSPGMTFCTDGRTIIDSDVMQFAGLTADHNYLHVNHEAAKDGPFGAPVAHGMLVMSVSQGLFVLSGVVRGTSLGLAGFSDWRFLKPVFLGDTIHAEVEVKAARRASRGARGICEFEVRVVNQASAVVQSGTAVVLVATKPERTSE
jgi:acyl dehydratase